MRVEVAGGPRWGDLGAGLCVAGLLLPEAVAYAALAHLDVGQALTALVVGLGLYALLGGSRFAIVAPTSSTATLLAAAIVSLVGGYTGAYQEKYTQMVMALTLLSGLLLLVLGLTKQGQLSSFISRPVLKGFAFALAISIVIKQLPDALGVELAPGTGTDPLNLLFDVARHISAWHGPTLGMALVAGGLMVLLKRWQLFPASLFVIGMAIATAFFFDMSALGIRNIGDIQMPRFALGVPDLTLDEWVRVAELSFGLVTLIYAESWGSMRTMALSRGDVLDPNRELLVLGACNAASALLHGMPVGAGFSATSANASSGAVSKAAGLVALVAVVMAIVFALPVLHLLPRPVLAVVVISALWHALSLEGLLRIWRMNRDRLPLVSSVLAVLWLGVLNGMLAAIALSLLAAVRRFSTPVLHELGRLGTTTNFVHITTQPEAQRIDGVLILRPEEPLFFGSAERVVAEVLRKLQMHASVTTVVLSLEESADLDSTALDCLLELNQSLAHLGKNLLLARVKTTVRVLLSAMEAQNPQTTPPMFWSVVDAIDSTREHPLPLSAA